MKLADSIVEEFWFGEGDQREGDEEASRSLAASVAAVEGLRPLSEVTVRIMALFADSDYRLSDVIVALEEDPALAARVIRTANAPWFAWGGSCANLNEAVIRLGSDTVVELVIATSVMDALKDVGGAARYVRDHCASVASMMRVLALEYRPDCTEGALLCGLFHDVGKLLLIQSGEFTYAGARQAGEAAIHRVRHLEREQLGYDHAVLGAHVLHRWNVPDPIPRAVAWHHQLSRAYSAPGIIGPTVALLRMADRLEPLFRRKPDRYDQLVGELAVTPEALYLGLDEGTLLRSWENLFYAFHEANTVMRF